MALGTGRQASDLYVRVVVQRRPRRREKIKVCRVLVQQAAFLGRTPILWILPVLPQ